MILALGLQSGARAARSPYRCALCKSLMVVKPGLGQVCLARQPTGRCKDCGVLAGEAYVEKQLYDGRCWSCRQSATRANSKGPRASGRELRAGVRARSFDNPFLCDRQGTR